MTYIVSQAFPASHQSMAQVALRQHAIHTRILAEQACRRSNAEAILKGTQS